MYRRPRPPLKLIADSGKTRRGEKEEEERKSRVAYTCELCACERETSMRRATLLSSIPVLNFSTMDLPRAAY